MSSSRQLNRILAVVCFIFFSLGLVTASIGPLLGEFSANTGASLAAVGVIFTAFFLGALIAQIINGMISERFGLTPLLIGGAMLAAVGLVGMSFSHSLPLLLGMALITGYGHGSINLCGNLIIATEFKNKRVTAVNFINIFYGGGAFIGPALIGLIVSRVKIGVPVFWLGAVLIFASALLMIRVNARQGAPAAESQALSGQKSPLFANPILWALALLSLFYGGSETGMAGWTTTYLQQSVSFSLERGAFVTSGFYVMVTLGRIICSWLGTKLSGVQVLATTLSATFVGTVIFVAGYTNPVFSVIGVLVIGLGYGGTYPTVVALTSAIFHKSPGKAVGLVISLGSIGGMTLPSLQGVLIDNSGPRPFGFFIAAQAILMLGLLAFARWRMSRPESAVQTTSG